MNSEHRDPQKLTGQWAAGALGRERRGPSDRSNVATRTPARVVNDADRDSALYSNSAERRGQSTDSACLQGSRRARTATAGPD